MIQGREIEFETHTHTHTGSVIILANNIHSSMNILPDDVTQNPQVLRSGKGNKDG